MLGLWTVRHCSCAAVKRQRSMCRACTVSLYLCRSCNPYPLACTSFYACTLPRLFQPLPVAIRPHRPVGLTLAVYRERKCTENYRKRHSKFIFLTAVVSAGIKKVAHTRLPSSSRFLAVSLQVTEVINPAVGCHYFPTGLQLPPQPLGGLLPVLLLGEQRNSGCEQFA